jgi:hypothetical protein
MALGPPPGRADLTVALAPLYEAGAKAAAQLALATSDRSSRLLEQLIELIEALQPVRLSILTENLDLHKDQLLAELTRLEELQVIRASAVDNIAHWSLK